ncbi:MAG: putative toxin-antitoxin system toxin component, PIN family [Dehalococcoidia bacterium]|nr:putative toxin-antitoxin system toxin component, PIN family [Dehalococcoidia bacterium]
MPSVPRIFVDTNVLVSGICFVGLPYEILRLAIAGEIRLVLSHMVLDETRRVIHEEFPQHAASLERLLLVLPYDLQSDPTVNEVESNLDLVRDRKDIPIALSAIASRADVLVSGDKHLAAQDATTALLRSRIAVLTPAEFFGQVMDWGEGRIHAVGRRRWEDIGGTDALA